ncbi:MULTISPECIES: hypothetical protein [unclassified Streptomyces]|uniref:hypothetical protein n=1 Tax=unclassified Streptomyces TaxID=2593676 RepID=UPI003BB72C70
MNTKLVNSAAGVICAALEQNRVPAGIATALESAGLLMSPEIAESLEKRTVLLREVQAMCRQRGKEIAGRKAYGDRLKAENEELRARVAELEAAPFAWAERLDAKSLDNFLITLGAATEHEPMSGAIDAIHQLVNGFRAAVSGDRLTALLAPTQALTTGACDRCGMTPEQWCPGCAKCRCATDHDAGCPQVGGAPC